MLSQRLVLLLLLATAASAQVTLHPNDNVPQIVSSKPTGTTFIFTPGTYRLAHPIVAKDNDKFIGETECAPPESACPAIISGAIVIGPAAKFDGVNYRVTGQTQKNPRGVTTGNCDPGWLACILPEDLYFDGVPLRHLDSQTLPTIGPGEWWFDYDNHVIYFHDDPAGHTVETSLINNGFGGPADNVTLQYLTVEKFASMYPVGAVGMGQGPRALQQGRDWTVQNCEIRLNHGYGVRLEYRMHVLNNYIHDNGQNGVAGGLGNPAVPESESTNSGILIQGNTISHNDYAHFNPGFGSGGIKIGSTSGVVVRGNTIENNEGSGVHFDEDCQNELVDGNLITGNSDASGLEQEIGYGRSVFRNNLVLGNGAHLNSDNWSYQISVRASSGVEAYCNVMEIPAGKGIGGWGVLASKRGASKYPPFSLHVARGNFIHHNTVIWEEGANGEVGFRQGDTENQSDFFASNTPPDYNEYHLPRGSDAHFVYDNDNGKSNRPKPFSNHQRVGADVHSKVDTNNHSGFPTVRITSPNDLSSVGSPVTVTATADDKSGIRKVEFYVDWTLQGTVNNPPYEFNWSNGSAGPHTVAAMAYSNAGVRACYAVTLKEQ